MAGESQTGGNSHPKGFEYTIESNFLTVLIFTDSPGKQQRKNDTARSILKPAKKSTLTNVFQDDTQ
jgi:hypothetical protein